MQPVPSAYYAYGKLMLTGEYAVMHGAHAFALPTRFGQHLKATPLQDSLRLLWKARDADGSIWLEAEFSGKELLTDKNTTETDLLRKLLLTASDLNPHFNPTGWSVETRLEFSRHWGLGSSSTLVALIARWAECPAFDLFFASLTGSGYDVAVAMEGKPLLYKLHRPTPQVTHLEYRLPDRDSLRFVYLGRKQSSLAELRRTETIEADSAMIADIDAISLELPQVQSTSDFDYLLSAHERLVSRLIGIPPIRDLMFKGYPHLIKSLGAWGGDFVMVRILDSQDEKFFTDRGYTQILKSKEILLDCQ